MPSKSFYVLWVEDGQESRIKRDINRKKKVEGLEKLIGRVITPRYLVPEMRTVDGKKKHVLCKRKRWPGYLIANMHWDTSTHFLVKSTRGVFGILPLPADPDAEWSPIPLDSEEACNLLIQQSSVHRIKKEKSIAFRHRIGDTITICDGPWRGMKAKILDIDQRSPTDPVLFTVEVIILGRTVPVTLTHREIK